MQKTKSHNPDILNCLANLSSDEIPATPNVANEMLDMIPGEIWANKDARFLDPCCKSGVFLREIAKRLVSGLEKKIPDKQKRINHILKNQLFGIAITELTSLISRRSVYCNKTANGKYSICSAFDDEQGNIIFEDIKHTWGKDDKCVLCKASKKLDRSSDLETHAYQFIHTKNAEEIFNMKFDVVIGNPPYHLEDAGDSTSSSPIYQNFIEQAKKLNPRFLSMIVPSRWFAGGKGMDTFRKTMLSDRRISHLFDFPVSKDVFPGIKLIGGVCYFLWERGRDGPCIVTTQMKAMNDTTTRELHQFDTFVRFNKAVSILEKIKAKDYPSLSTQISKQKPFGLRTYARPTGKGTITLYATKKIGTIEKSAIPKGMDMLKSWKVLMTKAYGEGGEVREYPRMILNKPIVAKPNSACTETYIVVGKYNSKIEAENLDKYLRTKFLRLLVGLRKNTQDITDDRFSFVPLLSMKKEWSDTKLNAHFGLTADEISFISMIVRPMESKEEVAQKATNKKIKTKNKAKK
jgi:site-specific DNA-methyltransferase (adenine-specific)